MLAAASPVNCAAVRRAVAPFGIQIRRRRRRDDFRHALAGIEQFFDAFPAPSPTSRVRSSRSSTVPSAPLAGNDARPRSHILQRAVLGGHHATDPSKGFRIIDEGIKSVEERVACVQHVRFGEMDQDIAVRVRRLDVVQMDDFLAEVQRKRLRGT